MMGVNEWPYNNDRPGKPYSLKHCLKGLETHEKIRNELNFRALALSGSPTRANRKLGGELEFCGRIPCGSAACPRCFHRFRQWSFAEFRHLSEQFDPVLMMTVLFYSEMMTDKQLFAYDFQKLMNRLWRQLERSGFTCPVVGYLEFDYHAESGLWLPHFHLMVLGDEPEAMKEFRRFCSKQKRVNGGASVSRPVHVSKLKDAGKQLSYLCKSYCSRIEAYSDQNGKRRTKKYRLKPNQLKLSLRVMDRLEFTGRLFLYGARRVGSEIRVAAVNDKF